MKKAVILAMLCLVLAGCASLPKFPSLSSPDKPRTLYNWEEKETRTPLAVGTDAEGRLQVVDKVERTINAHLDSTPAKLTLGQRIGRFFAGLSLAGIAFVAISLIFFGGAPIIWVVRKFFAARQALKVTVAAIENMNADDKERLKVILAQKQDTKDKEYVAKLKAELAKDKFKAAA